MEKDFRFYDNRQKYLMFVNTCSEKAVIAERVLDELADHQPNPPALRFFDAGVGDGTVLAKVLRGMHRQLPRIPFYVAGKEISLEDIRLTLDKMADRFFEHPEMVLALTNISYADAPWLNPRSPDTASRLVWREFALEGTTSAEFEQQIEATGAFLSDHWKTRADERTGRLIPEIPTVVVLYRKDCRFMLDGVIPRHGKPQANFDLVLASQPYRLQAEKRFKAERIIAPLAQALGRGGRLLGIHSAGQDPGQEIVRRIWPDENPFVHSSWELLEATRAALGDKADEFDFAPETRGPKSFRYHMHTLPDEIDFEGATIGTSTLLAAWNAATYVAQVADNDLTEAMGMSAYLDATRDVLRKHGELWFNDEAYVIQRKR